MSIPYASLFAAAGARHHVDPALLAAVAKAESNFNPRAVSPAGALGLMQLMPSVAHTLNVDPFNPAQAIDAAARLFKQNLQKFGGSVALAAAAYNAGPGAVIKYAGVPPYPETQNYVRQVLQYQREFEGAFGSGDGFVQAHPLLTSILILGAATGFYVYFRKHPLRLPRFVR